MIIKDRDDKLEFSDKPTGNLKCPIGLSVNYFNRIGLDKI